MKPWVKNLKFPDDKFFRRDLPQILRAPDLSNTGLMEIAMLAIHQERGIQMSVSKAVSDDLQASDLQNVRFEDVAWPAHSIEFFFDDPDLPTLLMLYATPAALARMKLAPPEDRDNTKPFIRVLVQERHERGSSAYTLQANYQPAHMDRFVQDSNECRPFCDPNADALEPEEAEKLAGLVLLCYKVLVFSQVPRLKPAIWQPYQLPRDGGRPGVGRRPRRPIHRVIYLPAARKTDEGTTREKGPHTFRGRRGHFHHYRDDCFVNKKGTVDYWAPIPGPDGSFPKTVYRVVKPRETKPNLDSAPVGADTAAAPGAAGRGLAG